MSFYRVIIVIVCFTIFTYSFKKAAGSLSLKDLNTYSIGYYDLLLFAFIGASITFLGFRDHYLLIYVEDEAIFEWGYFAVVYSITILPWFIILFNRLMGIRDFNLFYTMYRKRKVDTTRSNENTVFQLTFILSIIGAAALIYTFYSFGSVPLLKLLTGTAYNVQIRVSFSRNFAGNEYIRNILALAMIPTLSYLAFIYYRVTNSKRWKILFAFLFIMSVLCKTYALEKSPIIYYLFYFYLIDCMLEKKTSSKKAYRIIIIGFIILVLAYIVTGYVGSWFSLRQGIFSRMFISQVATYFLHLQSFSTKHSLLMGASFPRLLGGEGLRSGRVVMQDYNYLGVVNGTAGVMNTLYSGEAFANYGIIGLLTSPIIVAFFMTVIPTFVLKQEKDPINITIYIMLASAFTTQLVAGYVDFIYNASAIVLIILLIAVKAVASGGKIVIRRNKRGSRV